MYLPLSFKRLSASNFVREPKIYGDSISIMSAVSNRISHVQYLKTVVYLPSRVEKFTIILITVLQ